MVLRRKTQATAQITKTKQNFVGMSKRGKGGWVNYFVCKLKRKLLKTKKVLTKCYASIYVCDCEIGTQIL